MKKRSKILFVFIIVLTVAYIWINSFMPESQSSAQSSAVREILKSAVQNETQTVAQSGFSYVLSHIRKAAHVFEYLILGFELAVFAGMLTHASLKQRMWNAFSGALFVSVIDESIQIISGRGPLVKDVLLDSVSALSAILIVFIVYIIKVSKTRKKSE